ncbi:MAG: hypothetical protein JXA09_11535 [Anaerolineae bacterium]|nr:hypothetical protein [Anaerolineae bacterium]
MSHRAKSLAHTVLLLILSRLLVAAVGGGAPAAWSQSPVLPGGVSPLPTTAVVIPLLGISPLPTAPGALPDLGPGDSPLSPAPGHSPLSLSSGRVSAVWSSPLPWIGVGVALFGVVTWAALSIGRRGRADEDR